MFPSTVILSLLLAAVSSATPIQRDASTVTLGFAHQINPLGNNSKTIAEIDRARASKYLDHTFGQKAGKVVSVGVTNAAVTYTAQVGIGSPATKCGYTS